MDSAIKSQQVEAIQKQQLIEIIQMLKFQEIQNGKNVVSILHNLFQNFGIICDFIIEPFKQMNNTYFNCQMILKKNKDSQIVGIGNGRSKADSKNDAALNSIKLVLQYDQRFLQFFTQLIQECKLDHKFEEMLRQQTIQDEIQMIISNQNEIQSQYIDNDIQVKKEFNSVLEELSYYAQQHLRSCIKWEEQYIQENNQYRVNCHLDNMTIQATQPNRKAAKTQAAQQMLIHVKNNLQNMICKKEPKTSVQTNQNSVQVDSMIIDSQNSNSEIQTIDSTPQLCDKRKNLIQQHLQIQKKVKINDEKQPLLDIKRIQNYESIQLNNNQSVNVNKYTQVLPYLKLNYLITLALANLLEKLLIKLQKSQYLINQHFVVGSGVLSSVSSYCCQIDFVICLENNTKSKQECANILVRNLTSTYFKCVKSTHKNNSILLFLDDNIKNISIRIFLKKKVGKSIYHYKWLIEQVNKSDDIQQLQHIFRIIKYWRFKNKFFFLPVEIIHLVVYKISDGFKNTNIQMMVQQFFYTFYWYVKYGNQSNSEINEQYETFFKVNIKNDFQKLDDSKMEVLQKNIRNLIKNEFKDILNHSQFKHLYSQCSLSHIYQKYKKYASNNEPTEDEILQGKKIFEESQNKWIDDKQNELKMLLDNNLQQREEDQSDNNQKFQKRLKNLHNLIEDDQHQENQINDSESISSKEISLNNDIQDDQMLDILNSEQQQCINLDTNEYQNNQNEFSNQKFILNLNVFEKNQLNLNDQIKQNENLSQINQNQLQEQEINSNNQDNTNNLQLNVQDNLNNNDNIISSTNNNSEFLKKDLKNQNKQILDDEQQKKKIAQDYNQQETLFYQKEQKVKVEKDFQKKDKNIEDYMANLDYHLDLKLNNLYKNVGDKTLNIEQLRRNLDQSSDLNSQQKNQLKDQIQQQNDQQTLQMRINKEPFIEHSTIQQIQDQNIDKINQNQNQSIIQIKQQSLANINNTTDKQQSLILQIAELSNKDPYIEQQHFELNKQQQKEKQRQINLKKIGLYHKTIN